MNNRRTDTQRSRGKNRLLKAIVLGPVFVVGLQQMIRGVQKHAEAGKDIYSTWSIDSLHFDLTIASMTSVAFRASVLESTIRSSSVTLCRLTRTA